MSNVNNFFNWFKKPPPPKPIKDYRAELDALKIERARRSEEINSRINKSLEAFKKNEAARRQKYLIQNNTISNVVRVVPFNEMRAKGPEGF